MRSTTLLNKERSPWMRRHSPGLVHRRPLKWTTPSPSWKDTLKLGCLERARRKRQEAIWKCRRCHDHDPQVAKQLVQDELRESGVSVREGKGAPPTPSLDAESNTMLEDDYAISESELYELMQEVEEELQRDEARVEKVMEEMELCEMLHAQHFEDQIADFEDWEDSRGDDLVLCPVCKDANLISLSEHGLVCPNHMNGSCALRLEAGYHHSIGLSNLRERLQTAYEVHSCTCSSPLEFEARTRDNGVMLVATCSMCDTHVSIV